MYVRLAFAVAAHLDPEVLIIDEVLAVGDYEFQQRCMGRIEEISGSGRTVLFVSHDMQAVTRLCDRAYWLAGRARRGRGAERGGRLAVPPGRLRRRGPERVYEPDEAPGSASRPPRSRPASSTRAGETTYGADVREPIGIEMRFAVLRETGPLFPKIKLGNERGEVVFNALDTDARWRAVARPRHVHVHRLDPAEPPERGRDRRRRHHRLARGGAGKLTNHINVPALVRFHVRDPGLGDSAKGLFTGQLRGGVRPLLDWTTEFVESRAYETA